MSINPLDSEFPSPTDGTIKSSPSAKQSQGTKPVPLSLALNKKGWRRGESFQRSKKASKSHRCH